MKQAHLGKKTEVFSLRADLEEEATHLPGKQCYSSKGQGHQPTSFLRVIDVILRMTSDLSTSFWTQMCSGYQ